MQAAVAGRKQGALGRRGRRVLGRQLRETVWVSSSWAVTLCSFRADYCSGCARDALSPLVHSRAGGTWRAWALTLCSSRRATQRTWARGFQPRLVSNLKRRIWEQPPNFQFLCMKNNLTGKGPSRPLPSPAFDNSTNAKQFLSPMKVFHPPSIPQGPRDLVFRWHVYV